MSEEVKKRKKKKRRLLTRRERDRWRLFWIVMIPYVILLILAGAKFLSYTEKCLIKYENSQSVHAMEQYFDTLQAQIRAGQLPADADLSEFVGEYAPRETIEAMCLESLKGKKLSFAKAKDSYLTEEPVYSLFADGTEFGRVSWEGCDGEVILGVLTVLSWKVVDTEYFWDIPKKSYSIQVPGGYEVCVNGTYLTQKDVAEKIPVAEFDHIRQYADVWDTQVYHIKNAVGDIEIQCFDRFSRPVELNVSEDGSFYSADYRTDEEMPEEMKQMALNMATKWSMFMTRDLPGDAYGFYDIAGCLIRDSDYYRMAYRWATGVDITFTSDHTLDNPMFMESGIDSYVSYTDTCFSCHIYLKKAMHLTLTGQTVYDVIDSTFFFVKYDDTDDGEINPRWVIADMIQVNRGSENGGLADSNQ